MTTSDLLLDAERLDQLTAALTNAGYTEPLPRCISEAEAEVGLYITGYIVPALVQESWTRALALLKAYALAGAVAPDIKAAAETALAELRAIAEGKRPGYPRVPGDSPGTGAWGSETKFEQRTHLDPTE